MTKKLRDQIMAATQRGSKTQILANFNLKTSRKNQLLAFFKPETFLDKSTLQTTKIIDLAFKKLEEHQVTIDGAAVFAGKDIEKHSIMDRHYGYINTLSKNASKILTPEEKELVFSALGIKNKNTRILGGHEAFEISDMGQAWEFDNYWLEAPSSRIRGGFYVRQMKVANEDMVVVNGFHPQQLAHFTQPGRFTVILLVSSNTGWEKMRNEMLGDSFPEKALPSSIRGTLYKHPNEFGFQSVSIANNVMHLSAGPTEALFEIDNFLRSPFGIDYLKEEAKLAHELLVAGVSDKKIQEIITDKAIHNLVEHKDTQEAVEVIKSQVLGS